MHGKHDHRVDHVNDKCAHQQNLNGTFMGWRISNGFWTFTFKWKLILLFLAIAFGAVPVLIVTMVEDF